MRDEATSDGAGDRTREQPSGRGSEATRRSFVKTVGVGALTAGLGGSAVGTTGAAEGETHHLDLDLRQLPELSTGHYEGWAIFGEEKVSTGTFGSGGMHAFEVERDLSTADEVVITIEPDDDPSEKPSGVVVLAGALEDGTADLSFPLDVAGSTGSYILATPTDGSGTNETSGVWFLDPADGPSASLDVPDLSEANWTYEGWVVHGGQPVSTGRFDDPATADGSAPYSGEMDGPPFPGEDLLGNAPEDLEFPTDLTDGSSKVVVSVEPDIDGTDPTGPGPFSIKPLVDTIPADGTDHTGYALDQNAGTLPSGAAETRREQMPAEKHRLELDLSTLPTLSTGHYEGWAIFGEEKVSTGTFSSGGTHAFEVERDLSTADEVVITIEPDDDPSEKPSGVVVLAGAVEDGVADLAFPVELWGVEGSYILATPTDGSGTNETSGVWFLDPAGGPSASLDLPALPAGWTYEGWVVHEGQPVSTGRFDDPAMADAAAPHSGEMDGPPFPGEDLLGNAPADLEFPTDLTDGSSKVVVSVEPDIDGTDPTGPAPFSIKPLVGAVPADGTDHTSYDLEQKMGTVPLGTARIKSTESTGPVLGVDLSAEHLGQDGTVTATIALSEAQMGLSGFDIDLTVGDPSVATISGASYHDGLRPVEDPRIADDGSSVALKAGDVETRVQPGDTDVELATVTFEPGAAGETTVGLTVDAFQDEEGSSLATSTVSSTLSVAPVAEIDGALPADPDGDQIYENLNGNDGVDFDDVVLYFEYLGDPVLTDHVSAYDFNGNEMVDFDDVVELFSEVE